MRKSIKVGVQIPLSVEEAWMLDKELLNGLQRHAREKEMKNVMITWSKEIPYNIIFDVNFDLTRR